MKVWWISVILGSLFFFRREEVWGSYDYEKKGIFLEIRKLYEYYVVFICKCNIKIVDCNLRLLLGIRESM